MSGTSADGIDAVLVDLTAGAAPRIEEKQHSPYPPELLKRLLAVADTDTCKIQELGSLDQELGQVFADAVNALLTTSGKQCSEIVAIGSHGHTIRHEPDGRHPFSLQIGNPSVIAQQTGITTVADFRARDIAAGGQGAPLVPAFHLAVFHSDKRNRTIVNIGGIANVTYLPSNASEPVLGFDTGPGNTLLDHWVRKHKGVAYDAGGAWAATGPLDEKLLDAMISDPYFSQPPPKSTGRERFSAKWLDAALKKAGITPAPESVQASLTHLTAESIAAAINTFLPETTEIYVCGGGSHNRHLVSLLKQRIAPVSVTDTRVLGIEPDWVEALAFAWLAQQALEKKPGNLPSVTGASQPVILGGIYPA